MFLIDFLAVVAFMFDLLVLTLLLCNFHNFLQYFPPTRIIAVHFGQHDVECPEHTAGADVVLEQSA